MSQVEKFLEVAGDKLSVSELLFENEAYGDAVSRAYYAMYNAARALLFLKDSKPKTHEGTASELGKLYRDEIGADLARQFSKIQNDRLDADYEPSKEFSRDQAREILDTAERFVQEARQIVEDPS